MRCGYPVGRTQDALECPECGRSVSESRAWMERHALKALRLEPSGVVRVCRCLGWSLLVFWVLLSVSVLGPFGVTFSVLVDGSVAMGWLLLFGVGVSLLLTEHGLWLVGLRLAWRGLLPLRRRCLGTIAALHALVLLTAVVDLMIAWIQQALIRDHWPWLLLGLCSATCLTRAAAVLVLWPPLVRAFSLARLRRLGPGVAVLGGVWAAGIGFVGLLMPLALLLSGYGFTLIGLLLLLLLVVWLLSLATGVLLLIAGRGVNRAG